jgi:hypothetical protein
VVERHQEAETLLDPDVVGVRDDDVVDLLALRRLELGEELLVRRVIRLLERDAVLLRELLRVLRVVVLGPVVEEELVLDLLLVQGRARDGGGAAAAAGGAAARGRRDRERAGAEQLAPVQDAEAPAITDVVRARDCVQIQESCA